VKRSGVQFGGHDLRRTAASLMVGASAPRLVVLKILQPRRDRCDGSL
jgi:hypothetical protein